MPDSARPGALRPGQDDKLELPEPPPEELYEVQAPEPEPVVEEVVEIAPAPEPEPVVEEVVEIVPAPEPEPVVEEVVEIVPAPEPTPGPEPVFTEELVGPERPDAKIPGAVRPDKEVVPEEPASDEAIVASPAPRPSPVDVVDVPPVIDRPFDAEECPCIIVNRFRLLNAEDIPDFNVVVSEVEQILEEQVQQQPETGYSIGQMQEAANVARNYYREKGLILTQVVVPVQTIQGGVVDLELYIGKLGRILAEGNDIYDTAVLEMAFGDLIGKPINKSQIEAALLRLTDYPGLTVFGVFQPGQSIGTADLVLKVQEEKRFDVAMRVDDHGTPETGRNRFRTIIDWNNLTNTADRLTLTVQQSYGPKENVFKSVAYERYIGSSYKARTRFDVNKFDVGGQFKPQNINGESEDFLLGIEKSFVRSRLLNVSTRLDFHHKVSRTETDNDPTNRDRLSTFTAGLDFDSVDTFSFSETGGGINFATVELSHGFNDFLGAMGSNADAQLKASGSQPSRQGNSDAFAEGQFTKIFATYTRLQTLVPGQNLLFRFEWQWSDDLLIPLEQYAVGGPENVRAVAPSRVLWDRAFFYSFEWLVNAPFIAEAPAFGNRKWGEILQFTAFYDYAIGRLNDPLATEQKGYDRFDGVGLGLRFNIPSKIDSRIFWAWEIGGDDPGNDRRPQIWGDFTYSF